MTITFSSISKEILTWNNYYNLSLANQFFSQIGIRCLISVFRWDFFFSIWSSRSFYYSVCYILFCLSASFLWFPVCIFLHQIVCWIIGLSFGWLFLNDSVSLWIAFPFHYFINIISIFLCLCFFVGLSSKKCSSCNIIFPPLTILLYVKKNIISLRFFSWCFETFFHVILFSHSSWFTTVDY